MHNDGLTKTFVFVMEPTDTHPNISTSFPRYQTDRQIILSLVAFSVFFCCFFFVDVPPSHFSADSIDIFGAITANVLTAAPATVVSSGSFWNKNKMNHNNIRVQATCNDQSSTTTMMMMMIWICYYETWLQFVWETKMRSNLTTTRWWMPF